MSIQIDNKVVSLVVNPDSPVNLELSLPSEITLQMQSQQGISGVYGSSEYAQRIDQVDSNTIYRGEAQPGSSESMTVWRIQKIVISGSSISVTWAGGNKNFSNRWVDRATLSYN